MAKCNKIEHKSFHAENGYCHACSLPSIEEFEPKPKPLYTSQDLDRLSNINSSLAVSLSQEASDNLINQARMALRLINAFKDARKRLKYDKDIPTALLICDAAVNNLAQGYSDKD